MSHEKGQVEHVKIELEDALEDESGLDGVCIWRSVPSKGQNHILFVSFLCSGLSQSIADQGRRERIEVLYV